MSSTDSNFFYRDTRLPAYLQYPEFLLRLPLSHTAKLIYLVLYNRARLSRRNEWTDEHGRVFVVYPVAAIARKIGKSESTVKTSMKELCEAGLLVKQPGGFSKPNFLYVKYPAEGQPSDPMKKPPAVSAENATNEGRFSGCEGGGFPPANKVISNRYKNKSDRGEMRSPHGRYQNIFLTENELSELRAEYPADAERFIEELSEYAASSGRTYGNYAAAIRRWAANDSKEQRKPAFENYEYDGEDSF